MSHALLFIIRTVESFVYYMMFESVCKTDCVSFFAQLCNASEIDSAYPLR